MRYEDFSDASPGNLVPTVFNARAFVPDPLPPEFDLAEVALPLAQAHRKLGELKGACRRLSNPYVLIRPLQRLEAQTSSAMEGTHTTADKLALAEAGVKKEIDNETKEVSNYIAALEQAMRGLPDNPITHRTLKSAHETLLGGVGRARGEDKLPGCFKRDQNMIGGHTLEKARFIPPPPTYVADAISSLESYINEPRKDRDDLIDIALVHYQFETIHPFADGNGRVGRMLISLMAISRGLLDVPALYVSPALEGVKDEYIERLYRVSAFGEWPEWLNFFCEAVCRTSERAVRTIDSIIALQDKYRQIAAQVSQSANLQQVVDMIFEGPIIRPKDIIDRTNVTDAAARQMLAKLVEAEILHEYRGVYPRVWIALELLELSTPSTDGDL